MRALGVPFKLHPPWNANSFHNVVWAHMSWISYGTKCTRDSMSDIDWIPTVNFMPLSLTQQLVAARHVVLGLVVFKDLYWS